MFGNVPDLFMTAPTHLPHVLNTLLSLCHLKLSAMAGFVFRSKWEITRSSVGCRRTCSIMHRWMHTRNKTANMWYQGLWLVLQLFYVSCCYTHYYKYPFFFLLPSEVTHVLGVRMWPVKHSLLFVHDTEGKRKASSNFLKFPLRNEAVLVVIVVLEHGLWKTRGKHHCCSTISEQ